ncbi:hypothetical protein AVEN_138109-1 [Araneus ventricosus]|uniref:Uncharacterized protein n=1 Tax=Araneus ventricosus TaxID=182803 RepID=A0A4Y2QIG7_ARAVE|nr:hypothetical protein AVEN_138109-1 [Araneus ventricosus]
MSLESSPPAERVPQITWSLPGSRNGGIKTLRYSEIEGEFKFKLLQDKREGWSDTCEELTTNQPFGVHFDIAKNPDRRHFQLSAVQRPDGTLTSTAEEDLQELLEFHFPSDPLQDSPAHAIIRLQSKHPPLTLDDPLFNPSELTAAVKNIRNKILLARMDSLGT